MADVSVMKAEPCDRIPRFCGAGAGMSSVPLSVPSKRGVCSALWVRWSDRAALRDAGSWTKEQRVAVVAVIRRRQGERH